MTTVENDESVKKILSDSRRVTVGELIYYTLLVSLNNVRYYGHEKGISDIW